MRYTTEVYPPTAHVEVLSTKLPDRPYVELGELTVKEERPLWAPPAIERLVEKAKALGADAIILKENTRTEDVVVVPARGLLIATPISSTKLRAIAIRYK